MSANRTPSLTQLELTHPLTALIRKEHGAPVLAQEPVRVGDFADVASEGWRDGCLRAGHPAVPLAAAPMRLSPILAEDSASRCAGFKLDLTLPDGKTTRCLFTFSCLRHVADRAAAPLLDAGVIKSGESYVYEVAVDSQGSAVNRPPENGIAVTVSLRSSALSYLNVPLRQLLDRATPMALQDDHAPPVFYTQEAFAKAESCARRGAQFDPQVETGGALYGSLATCPDSGEFFSIIHDVIEVQDADETQFSLSYSSRSWLRLQRIQQARQAAYPARAERLVGQAHGHPFRPNDGKVCAECEKRAACTLTSAWVSQDDQTWHKAVFARQPWALCHIFGLSARGDFVHQLFGLKDGRLQARGFYLLPEFTFD